MTRAPRRVAAGVVAIGLWLGATSPVALVQAPTTFAARVAQLSEPGGYFDTDNLMSNERSYLQVIPALEAAGVEGGAYVGVGPDQNFSYVAQIRPAIAFIIDVRRDNLLLHLLFKALFTLADTRVEYLSLLFGRAPPAHVEEWAAADVTRLAEYAASALDPKAQPAPGIDGVIKAFGVPLSDEDVATIHRFHRTFIERGPDLKFETLGRPPQGFYPSYRDLLVQTDPLGRPKSFLASEAGYAVVRSLQLRDLIIPVVGDLSGPSALAAIGRMMADRGDRLAALYTSNVESYLFTNGRFEAFVRNVSHLPHSGRSVVIRSVFGGYARQSLAAGYGSVSVVQPIGELLEGYASGRFRSYGDLVGQ